MKRESALIADKNLQLISTRKQNAALCPTLVGYPPGCLNFAKVKAIRYIGKQDVYNMEVQDHHNFSVNGGLIVHNSIDAVRYACENDMRRPGVSFD